MKKRIVLLASIFSALASAQTGPVTRHVGAGTGMVRDACTIPAVAASAPQSERAQAVGSAVLACYDLVPAAETYTLKLQGTKPPAPAPDPAPEPAPTGPALYFSDCQAGAAAGCVPGDNANPGTLAAPKRDLAGLPSAPAGSNLTPVNALPAGTRLLFNRGGAWVSFTLSLENPNATLASPLVLDAYGTGADPVLRVSGGVGIQFGGRWGNTSNDGGYTVRNVRLVGPGAQVDTETRGMWFVQNVRGITLDNVSIEGFRWGIESSLGTPYGVSGLSIRNSRISNNRAMGILGSYSDAVIEGNTFEGNNNITGSSFNHAIYFSHGNRVAIRNNQFLRNSVVNGECLGGNVTAHGVIDGLLIEGNTITQDRAAGSCYGFAVTAGYSTSEEFRNVVVRGNTVINVGMAAIAANAAPGIVVEGNRIINTQATTQYGIWVPANGGADGPTAPAPDATDRDAIVRNNTVCFVQAQGSVPIVVTAPGSLVEGNAVRTGADASTGACAL